MSKNRKKPIRRKGRMKQWSIRSLNTGPTMKSMASANPIVLSEYTSRGRNLGKDMSHLDARFLSTGVVRDPDDPNLIRQKHGDDKNEPRRAAMRRRAEELVLEAQALPDVFCTVLSSKLKRVCIYFNQQHTCYFFVKEEYTLSIVKKSITYSTLASAKQAFMTGQVKWYPPELITSATGG